MVTKAFYTLSIIPFGLYITILCIITFSSSLCCELLEDNDFIFFILVVLNALRHLFQLGCILETETHLNYIKKKSLFLEGHVWTDLEVKMTEAILRINGSLPIPLLGHDSTQFSISLRYSPSNWLPFWLRILFLTILDLRELFIASLAMTSLHLWSSATPSLFPAS